MIKIIKKGKGNFQKFILTKNHKYKKIKTKLQKFKKGTNKTVFQTKIQINRNRL